MFFYLFGYTSSVIDNRNSKYMNETNNDGSVHIAVVSGPLEYNYDFCAKEQGLRFIK